MERMEKEEIQKLLESISKGGIQVNGDFVVSKHVENEIGNVENGGIGIQIVNGKGESHQSQAQVTDEQINRAITAINGKDNVLKHQQGFLGICCYLVSCHKWPRNKETTSNRINQLPDANKWEIPCKWESIRKFSAYKFAMTDYSEWDEYNPPQSEREIFNECRDVARAFERQLKIEMQK